jgi:thymidine kinase
VCIAKIKAALDFDNIVFNKQTYLLEIASGVDLAAIICMCLATDEEAQKERERRRH